MTTPCLPRPKIVHVAGSAGVSYRHLSVLKVSVEEGLLVIELSDDGLTSRETIIYRDWTKVETRVTSDPWPGA